MGDDSEEANGQNGPLDPNQLDSLQQSSPLSTVEQLQAGTNVSKNCEPQHAAESKAITVKVSRNTQLKPIQINAIEPESDPSKIHRAATSGVEGSMQEYFGDRFLGEGGPPHVTDDAQSKVQSNIPGHQASDETSHHATLAVVNDRDPGVYSKKPISELEEGPELPLLRTADNITEAE